MARRLLQFPPSVVCNQATSDDASDRVLTNGEDDTKSITVVSEALDPPVCQWISEW